MKLTRRNALIGLGTVVAGSGALVGTGAFSQVTADRSVSASIAADGSALLGLSVDNTNIASISSNTLQVDVTNLNQDAVTVFDSVFTIDNNGEDGVGIAITPYDSSDTEITGSLSFSSNANNQDLTSYPSAAGDDHNLDPEGGTDETVTVGITFDDTAGDPTQVSYIEIDADASQYQT